MNKQINGYDGRYYVSPFGVVTSRNWCRSKKEGVLKPILNTNGYLRVFLSQQGKKKNMYIHRLVAETFLPNPDNMPCINHKDGNKTNNNVTNLEWCSYSYNSRHAIGLGLTCVPRLRGENHPRHKLTAQEVRAIRRMAREKKRTFKMIAKEFGVSDRQVSKIAKGKQWRELLEGEISDE